MIVNPGNFQVIIFYKHKGSHTNQITNIDQKEIKVASKVKPLGIDIDDKLVFNHYINNICKFVSNQLNETKPTNSRNATNCNNHNDLHHLSFALKISLFSEVYLEPRSTSLMQDFCENSYRLLVVK